MGFLPSVATIASWDKVGRAVEHKRGAHFVNAGKVLLVDPEGLAGADEINAAQGATGPTEEARWDEHTFAHGIRYLQAHRPRFLHISLNDSDEYGHLGDLPAYLESLRTYDRNMIALVDALESMGTYGQRTTLIVTTDHGRGSADRWKSHGANPESAAIWMYARGPHTLQAGIRKDGGEFTHLDLRPTIERLLGLCPLDGASGTPMEDLLGFTSKDAWRCIPQ